ncbi:MULTISPECIES: hypothetical protein [Sediminibacillus]|uniref:hypothetical protein n=1 Tax=Sediminibacillus TaxID=482460 RepID=UPI0004272DA7|nr:hypothetical protein [Sediminibacillus terrae]
MGRLQGIFCLKLKAEAGQLLKGVDMFMKTKIILLSGLMVIVGPFSVFASPEKVEESSVEHNWERMDTEYEIVPVDTHTYTVWRNFIRKTRKCDISHRIKTDVWYCDLHHHTRSSSSIDEIIHSEEHSH